MVAVLFELNTQRPFWFGTFVFLGCIVRGAVTLEVPMPTLLPTIYTATLGVTTFVNWLEVVLVVVLSYNTLFFRRLPVKLMFPMTSSVYAGLIVPIPMFDPKM